jgi:hypothetical protein
MELEKNQNECMNQVLWSYYNSTATKVLDSYIIIIIITSLDLELMVTCLNILNIPKITIVILPDKMKVKIIFFMKFI